MSTSINKYISSTGFCSRRAADKLIEMGRVTINKKPASKGNRVEESDTVEIDGEPLKIRPKTIYLAFNKPVGITSTTDPGDKTNIINFINHPERIFPIGRLDKDSDGLIFLTNDGDIVNKILRAGNNHEKEYIVTVDKDVTEYFVQHMSIGVPVLGEVTKKCIVRRTAHNTIKIILTQGLNRQIRRMCNYLGYKVIRLKRIRIMNIRLGALSPGQWRYLDEAEINEINLLVKNSLKTEEASINTRTD